MKAVTWQGKRNVRVETVPDPAIQDPLDAIIRVTTTAICGSSFHRYKDAECRRIDQPVG